MGTMNKLLVKSKLDCNKITEGIRFTQPVFFDDGKNMFLAAGCPAKKYHINALKRWNIPFLWTDGVVLKSDEITKDSAKTVVSETASIVAQSAETASSAKVSAAKADATVEEEVSIEEFIENFDEL